MYVYIVHWHYGGTIGFMSRKAAQKHIDKQPDRDEYSIEKIWVRK